MASDASSSSDFDLPARLHQIQGRLTAAAKRCGRDPSAIALIAVSKTKPATQIQALFEIQPLAFGENYASELQQKQKALAFLPIVWHFIGHLQRRQVKEVVGTVELIHSIDRLELIAALQKEAAKKGMIQLGLLQVKLGGEETKGGFLPEEVKAAYTQCQKCPNLKITGLMTLPPFEENPEKTRPYFKMLRQLRDELGLLELSMGMSHDFEVAIEEGATMIRIGTALFGERL